MPPRDSLSPRLHERRVRSLHIRRAVACEFLVLDLFEGNLEFVYRTAWEAERIHESCRHFAHAVVPHANGSLNRVQGRFAVSVHAPEAIGPIGDPDEIRRKRMFDIGKIGPRQREGVRCRTIPGDESHLLGRRGHRYTLTRSPFQIRPFLIGQICPIRREPVQI